MSQVTDFTEQFDRCLMNEPAFCGAACPFGLEVRRFIEKIRQNRLSAAFKQYRDAVVFPGIVSELCDRPCEAVCPLAGIDAAIDLRGLEQMVTNACEEEENEGYNLPLRNKKIAVIGAGLSGLACALKLAYKKYEVVVFEAENEISSDIAPEIYKRFGNEVWTLRTGIPIGSLDGILGSGFSAVYIATGENGNDFELAGSGNGGETDSLPWKIITDGDFPRTNNERDNGARGGLHDLAADAGICFIAGGALTGSRDVYAIADGITAAAAIDAFIKTGVINTSKPPQTTKMVLAEFHTDKYRQIKKEKQNNGIKNSSEADRCLMCRCDACMVYCDLPAYTKKWPPRIRDEVFATTLPGKAEVKATPAKRLINMDNLSGVFEDVCPMGIDLDGLLLAGRQSMHRQGKMPWAFREFWLRDMEHANSDVASLVLNCAEANSSQALAFFPGCQIGASSPSIVKAAWDELNTFNKDGRISLSGLILKCCGAPALWSGDEDLFGQVLDSLRKNIASLGRPKLVCACPSCIRIFGTYAPDIDTVSLYEVLQDNHIAEAKGECIAARLPETRSYAVFDACAAVRLPGTDRPGRLRESIRDLARDMGIFLSELPVQEEVPRCCGFGGQPESADPKYARHVAEARAAESDLPYLCYCMNCREAFQKTGKESAHILELRYKDVLAEPPQLSPSVRRENRERLRTDLLCHSPACSGGEHGDNLDLRFDNGVRERMDAERLLIQDVCLVIEHMRNTKESVLDKETGVRYGYLVIGRTTLWVSCSEKDQVFTVHSVYAHRMAIVREPVWTNISGRDESKSNGAGLYCGLHETGMLEIEAEFSYLDRFFKHKVWRCPVCGFAYVSEELARGRIRDVELSLENK